MRPLTTHRSTCAARGGDHGRRWRWRWRSRRCRSPARAPDGEGDCADVGDAAGLLGRRREPARREASGSRVGAGAGDGLALRRRRRGAHAASAARRARPRSRATAPLRAAAPAHARRRRMAVRGQRGRDRLHGRRARGGRGAGARRRPSHGRRLVLRRAARRRPRIARLRRSVARLSRRARARVALPHVARRPARGACANATPPPTRWRSLRSRAPVRRRQPLRRGLVRPRRAGARLLAADRLSRRPLPLRELPRGRRMRPMLMARAGALAGAGALAAASLACRRARARAPAIACASTRRRRPSGFDATFSIAGEARLSGARGRPRSPGARWKGPRCATLAPARDGFELTARMPSLADVVGGAAAVGRRPAVAADARRGRARGDVDATTGATRCAREARVAAAAPRARPAQHAGRRPRPPRRRRLARHDAPGRQHRRARRGGGVASLLPDVAGDWRLADGAGRALALRSGATTRRRSTAGAPAATRRSPTPSRPAR